MARVKIEEIVDHLGSEFRKALADAISKEIPNAQFDQYQIFRTFKRAVGRKCSTWETVPDHYVETEQGKSKN